MDALVVEVNVAPPKTERFPSAQASQSEQCGSCREISAKNFLPHRIDVPGVQRPRTIAFANRVGQRP